MDLNQAKNVIIEAINVAILKGCYDLNSAKNIVFALDKILEQPNIEFGEIENQ
jgi:hypothetical protein